MRKIANSDNLSHPLTDLVTSLMIIFVLLLVIFLNNTSHAVADVREQLLEKLQKQLSASTGIKVQKDPKDPLSIVVIVPQALLGFASDKSDLPAKGKTFLDNTIPLMASVLCDPQFQDKIDSIIVEGHTDSRLVRGKDVRYGDKYNLSLSQARSMAVVAESLESLKLNEEIFGCFVKRISATGLGQRDPVYKADGTEDLDKSRRVVFKIRIASSEQQNFRKATIQHGINTL